MKSGSYHSLSRIMLKLFDNIVFFGVWMWVLLNYPKQYRHYLKVSRKNNRIPYPVIPRCANDKFLWRKLFDHDPRFVTISDKLAVKDWVNEEGIDVNTARVLWSGEDADQIPEELLQQNVVIKANHGWQMNIFIHDGSYNHDQMVKKANSFLDRTHGIETGEWGYFDIHRKLFVEEMLVEDWSELIEMKYYTYGKKIERLVVIYDRFNDMSADIWAPGRDGTLTLTDETAAVSSKRPGMPLPPTHHRATAITREIGSRFDHMRVDLFTDGNEVWLSELTVYNLSGFITVHGLDPDSPLNTSWDLRESWFLTTHQQGWRRMYANALKRTLSRQTHSP